MCHIDPAVWSAWRIYNDEQIREILVQEHDHQIDLATGLSEEVPNFNAGLRRHFAQVTLTLLASVGTVIVDDCGK